VNCEQVLKKFWQYVDGELDTAPFRRIGSAPYGLPSVPLQSEFERVSKNAVAG
jgi:hypothetical protein